MGYVALSLYQRQIKRFLLRIPFIWGELIKELRGVRVLTADNPLLAVLSQH